jgi:hypothetical protein
MKNANLGARLFIPALFLPFALQLLGWTGTPLGRGPCGAFGADPNPLEQPQGFYAQGLLWGICLQMALGFTLLMLQFMNSGPRTSGPPRPWAALAGALAALTATAYVFSRTTGLPVPSPLGWLWAPPAPPDIVGLLVLTVWLGQIRLALRWGRSPEEVGSRG